MTKKVKPTQQVETDKTKFKIIIEVTEKSFHWGFDEKLGEQNINVIEAVGALHYTANEILKKAKSHFNEADKV